MNSYRSSLRDREPSPVSDRILSSDEVHTPSSGFAGGVMEAVREAAAEPPPLPFPWGRFVAGLLACVLWAASSIEIARQMDSSVVRLPATELAAVAPELGFAAAVVLVCLAWMPVQRMIAQYAIR